MKRSALEFGEASPPTKRTKLHASSTAETVFTEIGRVKALFIKPCAKGKMEGVSELKVRSGTIEGKPKGSWGLGQSKWKTDCNVQQLTPRQLLISTTADLGALKIPEGSLRENICLDLHDKSLDCSQALASGGVVRIGKSNLELRLTFACEPCGHVLDMMKSHNLLTPSSKMPPSLRDLNAQIGRRGVLAVISHAEVTGSIIKEGDAVEVLMGSETAAAFAPALRYEELGYHVKSRIQWLLPRIPWGKIVSYKQLLQYVGAPSGYARAIPALLVGFEKAKSRLPVHRIVDSQYKLVRQLPEGMQKEALENEGLKISLQTEAVHAAETFLWQPTEQELYLKEV
eukprot:TRINITY_DN39539_c0_g1_i1.p1 TRINITY_DN39539_c0_g1~~TRINITY_DN39539_c0_g1_i1.p1  ORF type:complete len:342 (-),score=47.57 TRINITY_DN39539_c0_g1_i1:123-1148(-)